MLKSVKLKYSTMGAQISTEMDKEILTGLWKLVGVSDNDIEDLIDSKLVDADSIEGRIRNIAVRMPNKILAIHPIAVSNIEAPFLDEEYGVIYDDEISATYEENLAIAIEQFVMNNL